MSIFRIIYLLGAAVLVTACGGGGGSPGANLNQSALVTTAGESVILPNGAFQTYNVSGGVPPYRATSSEPAIVLGNVNDNTLSIGAVAGGVASVRVFDHSGAAVSISVTVGSSNPMFSTAPSAFTLRSPGQRKTCAGGTSTAGETAEYAIAGGARPYTISSDQPQVVAAEMIDASNFRVTAVSRGTASIIIRDNNNRSTPVTLTVNSGLFSGVPDMANSLTDVKISVGVESRVLISGGMPPYSVGGNIPATVNVSPACSDSGEFLVTGNLAGVFEIGFLDSAGSTSPKTKFTFTPDAASFRASPGFFSISEDAAVNFLEFQLFGFTGDTGTSATSGEVCIYVSDPSYFQLDARTTCSTFSAGSRKFRLIRGSRGNLCVSGNRTLSLQIIDSRGFVATGRTDEGDIEKLILPSITILDNGTACEAGRVTDGRLTVLPNGAVTLSPTVTVADVFVMGGSGDYLVRSSNETVATVAPFGNRLQITRMGAPLAGVQTTATITVTDNTAPTQSVTISVVNNGP